MERVSQRRAAVRGAPVTGSAGGPAISGPQLELPPLHVVPRAVLPADPAVRTDGPEAHRGVQGVARLVGLGDARAQRPQAHRAEPGEQRAVQRPTDAGAVVSRRDVDRDVGGPAIRGALVMPGSVRVADRVRPPPPRRASSAELPILAAISPALGASTSNEATESET